MFNKNKYSGENSRLNPDYRIENLTEFVYFIMFKSRFSAYNLLLLLVFATGWKILPQNYYGEGNIKILSRIESLADNAIYYPMETGDYAEFIEDTYLGFKVSRIREITGDTLLPAPQLRILEKISSPAYAATLKDEQRILVRKSNGDIYIWSDNSEHPLYLFSAEIGQFYPSHLLNKTWYVTGKMMIEVYGDTVSAVEFELVTANSLELRRELIADKYGLVSSLTLEGDGRRFHGTYWGNIASRVRTGDLIYGKGLVQWDKFLSHQEGNFRRYKYNLPPGVNLTILETIHGDTLMPDLRRYNIVQEKSFDGVSYNKTRYETISSNGYILQYHENADTLFKLSILVGDTLPGYPDISGIARWRVSDKYIEAVPVIELSSINTQPPRKVKFAYGIGKNYLLYPGIRLEELEGGFIGGVVYGDTNTVTSLGDGTAAINEFKQAVIYPNPFNQTAVVRFSTAHELDASLLIFDIQGALVYRQALKNLKPGEHNINIRADGLASGLYTFYIYGQGVRFNGKMILLK